MNKREQQQFAAFFQQIYETEELFDFIKLQLIQSQSYNPHLLFDLISNKSDNISLQQMRQYLMDKVTCNERELYQIFERFDWTRQGSIHRSDFLQELVPLGRQIQSLNQRGGSLTAEIEGHFISLIVEIIKRFRICEVIRKQLNYIQPYDAFQHIDYHKTGTLGLPELRKLLFQNDFNVTDRQLYYLLHGLRRRCYRDINLEVFCENLDPIEFGFYIAYQDQLQGQRAVDFANRSREEEEVMRRSRLQAQRIEHEFQKAQRKKQADLQRQLQLEDRVGAEIISHQEQKERQIRRAMLEEDRNIRYDSAGGQLYRRQLLIKAEQQRLENRHLNSIKQREQEVNAALTLSALAQQKQLQRSRRQRQSQYRQEIQRERQMIRSNLVAKQLDISRQRVQEESRRRFQEESRKAEEQNRYFQAKKAEEGRRFENERLRRLQQQSRRHEDEARMRNIQLSRRNAEEVTYQGVRNSGQRQLQESRRLRAEQEQRLEELRRKAFKSTLTSNNRFEGMQESRQRAREEIGQIRNQRIGQYQKELQRTRYDIYGQSRKTGELSRNYR